MKGRGKARDPGVESFEDLTLIPRRNRDTDHHWPRPTMLSRTMLDMSDSKEISKLHQHQICNRATHLWLCAVVNGSLCLPART